MNDLHTDVQDAKPAYRVRCGHDGDVGTLRELGGSFWQVEFPRFSHIMPDYVLGALIRVGEIICACDRCGGIKADLGAGPE